MVKTCRVSVEGTGMVRAWRRMMMMMMLKWKITCACLTSQN